jgi:anti-sigma B factor antagonist
VSPSLGFKPRRAAQCGPNLRAFTQNVMILGLLLLTLVAMLNDAPLTVNRREGSAPNTHIFTLSGPLTLRNMFEFQSELRNGTPPALTIFDLAGVPYMDSAGMGLLMNHYVHCQTRGARFVVAAANARVMDLLKVTKVDTVLPLAPSVEDAETDA